MANNTNKGVNPLAAGAVGAVIGSAAGALAAVVLTNQSARRNIGRKMGEVSRTAAEKMEDLRANIEGLRQDAQLLMESEGKQSRGGSKKGTTSGRKTRQTTAKKK